MELTAIVNNNDMTSFQDYIYIVGRNGSGQLGIGNKLTKVTTPQKINLNFKIKLIKCGTSFTVISTENNEIFMAGKCCMYNYVNFTKVNCNNVDLNIKNIFTNSNAFIVTNSNKIYRIIETNPINLELKELEFEPLQNIFNSVVLVTVYITLFYFVTKSNDLFDANGRKILTFPTKVKDIYVVNYFYIAINEFDDLLLYNHSAERLQSLQNTKIEKISVIWNSCLLLTKTKELFMLKENSSEFTKIVIKKEITENIIEMNVGLFNSILILKGNQFYIYGKTFIFGDYSEFTKLDIPTIDSYFNAVENYDTFFIFYRKNFKKEEGKIQMKLKQILSGQQLIDLDLKFLC
ncbi:hypothetical protein ABK040_003502 [Willaertia magna]